MTSEVEVSKPTRSPSVLAGVQLENIILWECHVTRGDGAVNSPGQATASLAIERAAAEGVARYDVTQTVDFSDSDGDLIIQVESTFVANYSVADQIALTDDQSSQFAKSVVMQVTPFQRELLATMTNRLGVQQFMLPLIRVSEISFDSDDSTPGVDQTSES